MNIEVAVVLLFLAVIAIGLGAWSEISEIKRALKLERDCRQSADDHIWDMLRSLDKRTTQRPKSGGAE